MGIVRRYELSDEDWAQIEPLLPRQGRGGRRNDHRTVMNGMFWVLRSGSAWRDLPERYSKWQTVYDRFVRRVPLAACPLVRLLPPSTGGQAASGTRRDCQ